MGLGLLAALAAALALGRWAFATLAPRWVRVEVSVSPAMVARGEEAQLVVEAQVQGWLPSAWLGLSLVLPPDWECPALAGEASRHTAIRLPWRGRVVRRYPLRVHRHGAYRVLQAHAEVWDPLGAAGVPVPAVVRGQLLVRPVPLTRRARAATSPRWGPTAAPSLFPDPLATRGVREYVPGDSLRHVHWPKTAQVGRLMVREFDTTADRQVVLVANLQTHEPYWSGSDPEAVEAVLDTILGLCLELEGQGAFYGLWANAPALVGPYTYQPPGRGPLHLATLTRLLAHLASQAAEPLPRLLRHLDHVHRKALAVVVTPPLTPEGGQAVARLAQKRPVQVIHVGAPPLGAREVPKR